MKDIIGNTPLIKITYEYHGKTNNIYTKLENYNLTGSIKDRMVYYVIKKNKDNGVIKENMPLIEATSGNTGIALAAIGAYYNHPVYIFMPDFVSMERKKIMEMYGANVTLISKEQGGFLKCIEEAKKMAHDIDGFLLNQFDNQDNVAAHYNTTGEEIQNNLDNIEYFVSGIGSGGTLMGVGKKLKERQNTKIIALEPDTMAILSNGKQTKHKIEGIGDEFLPAIVDKKLIDDVIQINDEDAINMARILSRKLGLGVGISSGANFLAAVLLKDETDKNVVTVFPDDNKKYISTYLSKEIDNNPNYISNQINLISIDSINKK